MSTALRRRLREAVPSAVLALTIYVPLLLTRPGRVGADTKTYLYLDPGRMLSRAPTMWDPNIGMGTVTHQNIGYLWPIGPWYWVGEALGLQDWVVQRLWLGTILFVAGLGVRYLLRTLGQEGPHVTAATFVYALTPYVLTLGARLSVILLPYAGLPWLIALAAKSLRRGGWRYPALFGLTVATIGSVNATALLLVGVAPVLWILNEVVVTREARARDALAATARIGVMTVGCSLWWIAGLWAQGGYGIEILRFTETAETVATASLSLEALRGLGYWFFYGQDRYGPWIAASRAYTERAELLAFSYLLPALGLVGAAVARFRDRAYFLILLVTGLFLAVGAHPWDDPAPAGAVVRSFLESDLGLSMRSLPRAAPLIVLAMSVFIGALVAAATRNHQRWSRPATAVVVVVAVAGLPPLWRGQMVDRNLDRPEEIPEYWDEAAAALDARGDGTRVLELPGIDFASYRWGTTVDPVTPGLMDRPYVARELIPYGSPPSADVVNAVDRRFQELVAEPESVAPMARFMGVGDIVVRNDLTYERYNTPRPRQLWETLTAAPDLADPIGFGGTDRNVPRAELPMVDEQELLRDPDAEDPPQVAVLEVVDPEQIVRTGSAQAPVVLSGDAEGLVDLAAAGLVTGHEVVLYSATFADDPDELRANAGDSAALVLTDTNRRTARRWSTVRDATGVTERAGQDPLVADPRDQRLEVFADAGDDAYTVTESRGGVMAEATSYGNAVTLTPEDDPANAVDGDRGTSWRIGGFSSATGERLRLTYRQPVTTDRVELLQAIGGVRNRFITEVELSFDDGEPVTVALGEASRTTDPDAAGQVVEFETRTFETLDITVTETDPGSLRRYDGVSSVGFAEVTVIDESGVRPVADDVIRLPVDMLDTIGDASQDQELAIVLTRQRTAGVVAVRSDPEPAMARTWDLPTDRSFSLIGQVRLAHGAPDDVVDGALGRPGADDGGVTATSKRRLPGGLDNRASAAIDGDPSTWYSPGFLDQRQEFVDYELPEPITFDSMSLTVLNDGRHSVPRVLRLDVDGEVAQRIELPDIADQPTENASHTFDVALDQPVTGSRITVSVESSPEALREVTTLDWFTDDPIVMPIGIVELGIDGLEAPELPAEVDGTCRTDLVEVDGEPVPVALAGTTEALLAGEAIDLVTCDGLPMDLESGSASLRTAPGSETGFDIDRMVLRSAPGGEAATDDGPLIAPEAADDRPAVEVTASGRTSLDLVVPDADDDYWLVLGQSYNEGWRATADGVDLGPPTLIDGYANGWKLPPGSDVEIHLEWAPQRVVWAMIAVSLAFVLAALVVVLVTWRRRAAAAGSAGDELRSTPLDERPAMPQALSVERLRRYRGPDPSMFAFVGTTVAAAVVGFGVIGPVGALVLAAAVALCLRVSAARPLLSIGGPVTLVATVAWMVHRQATQDLPPGFDWPTYFEGAQAFAWLAVLFVLFDAIVDRCWMRRWWPGRSS